MKKFSYALAILFLLVSFMISINSAQAQGYALDLDGSNDYINLGASSLLKPTDKVTVEVWAYASNWSSLSDGTIIGNEDGSYGWQLKVNYSTGKIEAWLHRNNAKGVADYALSSLSGGWHHIALTYDLRYLRLYVDGAIQDSNDAGSNEPIDADAAAGTTGTLIGADVASGTSAPQSSGPDYFAGRIDEVRIWAGVALTQAVLREWMHRELSTAHPNYSNSTSDNLKGYYKMTDATGNSLTDNSANSNIGSLINMTNGDWVSSTAPVPYTTVAAGNWNSTSTWNSSTIPNCTWAIVTIDDNTSMNVDVDAFMVTVNSGKTLTINSGKSLTLCGAITNNGTLTVEEEASFLDNGTLSGSGSYTVVRPITKEGWHYVSPPISSPTANSFWGSALYSWDETTESWIAQHAGDNLTPCRGYDTYYKSDATVNLTGTFNTGSQSISVTYTTATGATYRGWNLVGNPYPSYLDWDAAGWTKTNVADAIYVWDENQSNYTSYVNGTGLLGGSRYIPPAQGFLVYASTTGASIAMTNSCRVHSTESFRSAAKDDLLKLKISGQGYSDETIIRFDPHASNDFDGDFDAFKVRSTNISTPQIYTRSADMKELSINTFAGLYQNISVPLLARVGISGEYELSINIFEFDQNTHLYLEDLQDGKIYDINQNSKLTFNFGVNDAAERFIIHFTPLPTLESPVANGLDDAEEPISNVYSHDKDVYIDIFENNHGYVHIYNMNADEIYKGELRRSMNKIPLAEKANGYYFVKLVLDKEVTTHKVLIR